MIKDLISNIVCSQSNRVTKAYKSIQLVGTVARGEKATFLYVKGVGSSPFLNISRKTVGWLVGGLELFASFLALHMETEREQQILTTRRALHSHTGNHTMHIAKGVALGISIYKQEEY